MSGETSLSGPDYTTDGDSGSLSEEVDYSQAYEARQLLGCVCDRFLTPKRLTPKKAYLERLKSDSFADPDTSDAQAKVSCHVLQCSEERGSTELSRVRDGKASVSDQEEDAVRCLVSTTGTGKDECVSDCPDVNDDGKKVIVCHGEAYRFDDEDVD